MNDEDPIEKAISTFKKIQFSERQKIIDAATRDAITAAEKDFLDKTGLTAAYEKLIEDGWQFAIRFKEKIDTRQERRLFDPRFLHVNFDRAIKRKIEVHYLGDSITIDHMDTRTTGIYSGSTYFSIKLDCEIDQQTTSFYFHSASDVIVAHDRGRHSTISISVAGVRVFNATLVSCEEIGQTLHVFNVQAPYIRIVEFETIDKSTPGPWMTHLLELAAAYK